MFEITTRRKHETSLEYFVEMSPSCDILDSYPSDKDTSFSIVIETDDSKSIVDKCLEFAVGWNCWREIIEIEDEEERRWLKSGRIVSSRYLEESGYYS